MTIGIYKLVFNKEKPNIYIGQSRNIEERYIQHIIGMRRGSSSKKLVEAFRMCGVPELEILLECEPYELDAAENDAILIYNSVKEGLNTQYKALGAHISLPGELNGRAKYSNSQILDCLLLLISSQDLSLQQIANITGVGRGMVVDISCLNSHKWLEQEYPEEYASLKALKGKRKSRFYFKIKSPDGIIYSVEHLSRFCKEHNLDTGNISRVLRGVRNSYRGWQCVKD